MRTIDFSKVSVEFSFGDPKEVDMRQVLGNAINQNTNDIGIADFARKIYYAEGPIEIPGQMAGELKRIIREAPQLLAAAKLAVLALLESETKKTE